MVYWIYLGDSLSLA